MKEKTGPNPILFRLVWGTVLLVGVIASVVVYNAYNKRYVPVSDEIFVGEERDVAYQATPPKSPSPHLKTSLGIKENLVRSRMVVPNRPHNPTSRPTPENKKDFLRRREFTISTDATGLRIPDPDQGSRELSSNSDFKIVCIGASESFGWGVAYEDSYPAKLGDLLGVQVYNAGAPAGRLSGLVRWAEQNVEALQPELVLFALRPEYYEPNPVRAFKKHMTELQQSLGDTKLVVILPPLSTFNLQMPDINRLYYEADDPVAEDVAATTAALAPIPVLGLTSIFREKQRQYKSTDTIVLFERERMRQRLVSQGNVILEVPAPPKVMPVPGQSPGAPQVFSKEILSAFEENPDMREPYFFDNGHPDKEGYALFAELVADWLREEGLVPK